MAATVGEHGGTAGYTVGQRQGLGVALGEPRYVCRIDPLTNTIQLGRREDLETSEFTIERARSWPATRRRRRPVPCRSPDPPSRDADPRDRPTRRSSDAAALAVETDTPVWAAAPGQAAVLYDGDEVLGGGPHRAPRRRDACSDAGRPVARRSCSLRRVSLEPSLVLSVLVGIFHAALYVLIRGTAGGRLPLLVVAGHPRRVGR